MLHSIWDLPGPGIKSMSPALAGRFLITGPPGRSVSYMPSKSGYSCLFLPSPLGFSYHRLEPGFCAYLLNDLASCTLAPVRPRLKSKSQSYFFLWFLMTQDETDAPHHGQQNGLLPPQPYLGRGQDLLPELPSHPALFLSMKKL